VVHLITDASFEDGKHLSRQPRLQPVGAEGAEPDAQEAGQRSEQEESLIQGLWIIRLFAGP